MSKAAPNVAYLQLADAAAYAAASGGRTSWQEHNGIEVSTPYSSTPTLSATMHSVTLTDRQIAQLSSYDTIEFLDE